MQGFRVDLLLLGSFQVNAPWVKLMRVFVPSRIWSLVAGVLLIQAVIEVVEHRVGIDKRLLAARSSKTALSAASARDRSDTHQRAVFIGVLQISVPALIARGYGETGRLCTMRPATAPAGDRRAFLGDKNASEACLSIAPSLS